MSSPPTTHRISEIHKWSKEKCLELHPPFQRKPVWSVKNKSYLIDTILNGLPVPEIYIQVKTDYHGHTMYIVVDGQQRINAILEFIDGEYAIDEDESELFGGKEFSELEPGNRKDFWDYKLVTRELITSSEDEIRAIFKRLNKYVYRLNNQELRNATYTGHFIHLMNELAEDPFWSVNKIVTPADIRRMLDAEFISELFVGLIGGLQHKKEKLDQYYKMYDEKFSDKDERKKEFLRIQNLIEEILGDLRSIGWNNKTDFYSLFLGIAELSREYIFPAEHYNEIKSALLEFDKKAITEGEDSKDELVKTYVRAAEKAASDLSNRRRRHEIVRKLLIPYLTAKDPKRDFTEEERLIAWYRSPEKKCAICGKTVDLADYQLDHKISHSKGGKTELTNSQITHKRCNLSKGGR